MIWRFILSISSTRVVIRKCSSWLLWLVMMVEMTLMWIMMLSMIRWYSRHRIRWYKTRNTWCRFSWYISSVVDNSTIRGGFGFSGDYVMAVANHIISAWSTCPRRIRVMIMTLRRRCSIGSSCWWVLRSMLLVLMMLMPMIRVTTNTWSRTMPLLLLRITIVIFIYYFTSIFCYQRK